MDFRYAFVPTWRQQTTLTTSLVLAIMVAHALITGAPIQKPDLLLNLGIALTCGLILSIPVAVFRFSVTDEGLRTFSSWGRWRLVPWEAIAAAEPARYLMSPHLRLLVDGQRSSFWLPLHLQDMQGLRTAVIAQAGANHPLALALPLPAQKAKRSS